MAIADLLEALEREAAAEVAAIAAAARAEVEAKLVAAAAAREARRRGAVIGVLFALLFHLVNFAIALFSPTIHVLRLHYVEFFGTFFDPGGDPYRPLSRWSPEPCPEGP